mgnify:CR=1 FL=1
MVCKNCGADLKPGIKYCLECGSYVDDEEEELEEQSSSNEEISTDYQPVTFEAPKKKKRTKLNLSTSDYLIYAGLLIVMVGSIIVIIVALVRNNNQQAQPLPTSTTEVVQEDQTVTVDNYTVVIPGRLISTVQDNSLHVSDNVNYTFTFQLQEDDFDKYSDDHSILEEQLVNSKYEVLTVSEKNVNQRNFLIYQIKVDGSTKILYLTKANYKYMAMGIIEIFSNGNWEEALPDIDTVCSSINFQFE